MAISLEEVKQRRIEALKAHAEGRILCQWYYCLQATLEEQADGGLDEPDFSYHWIGGDYDTRNAVTDYLDAAGIEKEGKSLDKTVEFIKELIGDQLAEYGIELYPMVVTNGIDDAQRIYLVKPGEEPKLNRPRYSSIL